MNRPILRCPNFLLRLLSALLSGVFVTVAFVSVAGAQGAQEKNDTIYMCCAADRDQRLMEKMRPDVRQGDVLRAESEPMVAHAQGIGAAKDAPNPRAVRL